MKDGVDVVKDIFGRERLVEVATSVGKETQVELRGEIGDELRRKVGTAVAGGAEVFRSAALS